MYKLLRPVDKIYRVTQRFGNNWKLNGKWAYAKGGHNGIDYGSGRTDTGARIEIYGKPIYSSHDGVIKKVGTNGSVKPKSRGYGRRVVIEAHDGSYETIYSHMLRYETGIEINKHVKQGDVIGYANDSGFSYGSHLHYGLRPLPISNYNRFYGYIDPSPYIFSKEDIQKEWNAEFIRQSQGVGKELVWIKNTGSEKNWDDVRLFFRHIDVVDSAKEEKMSQSPIVGIKTDLDDVYLFVIDLYNDDSLQGIVVEHYQLGLKTTGEWFEDLGADTLNSVNHNIWFKREFV